MRKKVQLRVASEDQAVWFLLDDNGVVTSGLGVEMVQVFCHLSGQGTYSLSKSQLKKYGELQWEGTLRLLRQQSTFKRPLREAARKKRKTTKKTTGRRAKLQKAAEAFAVIVDDSFD